DRRVYVECSPEDFIDRWSQHLPERYQHAVRSFGLLSPRSLSQTSAATFSVLGQTRRSRPRPLSWAISIKRDFKWDPLLDSKGNRMKWQRRLPPAATAEGETVTPSTKS